MPRDRTVDELHAMCRGFLPMWVIYRPTTSDFPDRWVARMHLTIPEHKTTGLVLTSDTLEGLRAMLPPGLYRLGRHPDDDPVIEEVWL